MSEPKVCMHCNKPVVVNAKDYSVFEDMHWLWFHLNFEHDDDPDEPCQDPSYPWWHIEVLRKKLESIGVDPSTAIEVAINERWLDADK